MSFDCHEGQFRMSLNRNRGGGFKGLYLDDILAQ